MLPIRFCVGLGVMVMKVYSSFPNASELGPLNQMIYCLNEDTHRIGVLQHCRDAVSVVYCPSRLDWAMNENSAFPKFRNWSLKIRCNLILRFICAVKKCAILLYKNHVSYDKSKIMWFKFQNRFVFFVFSYKWSKNDNGLICSISE